MSNDTQRTWTDRFNQYAEPGMYLELAAAMAVSPLMLSALEAAYSGTGQILMPAISVVATGGAVSIGLMGVGALSTAAIGFTRDGLVGLGRAGREKLSKFLGREAAQPSIEHTKPAPEPEPGLQLDEAAREALRMSWREGRDAYTADHDAPTLAAPTERAPD